MCILTLCLFAIVCDCVLLNVLMLVCWMREGCSLLVARRLRASAGCLKVVGCSSQVAVSKLRQAWPPTRPELPVCESNVGVCRLCVHMCVCVCVCVCVHRGVVVGCGCLWLCDCLGAWVFFYDWVLVAWWLLAEVPEQVA